MGDSSYTEAEEQIFEAALQVFARKGKEGARMQEIADAAGINKAMLHYYFRSKDRLYEEVFGYVIRRFFASFSEAMRHADTFADALHAFIDAYIDFVKDHLDVMRLMVNENLSGGQLLGTHMQRMMKEGEQTPPRLFAEKVNEAIARGEIRPVDPFQTLLTVVAGCVFPFIAFPTVRAFNPAAGSDCNAFMEARKQHLFDLVYRGLKPETAA